VTKIEQELWRLVEVMPEADMVVVVAHDDCRKPTLRVERSPSGGSP
jgi:hypothetical protein